MGRVWPVHFMLRAIFALMQSIVFYANGICFCVLFVFVFICIKSRFLSSLGLMCVCVAIFLSVQLVLNYFCLCYTFVTLTQGSHEFNETNNGPSSSFGHSVEEFSVFTLHTAQLMNDKLRLCENIIEMPSIRYILRHRHVNDVEHSVQM